MDAPKRFLFLFLKTALCSCRCRHCLFAVSGRYPSLPVDQVARYLDPFVQARDAGTIPYGSLATFLGDAPLNYPDLAGGFSYLRSHDIECWYSVAANGFLFQSDERWRPYLQLLRQAGIEYLEFTLYGMGQTHDWFARRPGDFEAITNLAHLWQDEMDGRTSWAVFLHKRNLAEAEELVSKVGDEFGQPLHARLWDYLGFAATKSLEDLRLDVDDLEGLDAGTRAQLEGVKPERDWVAQLSGSQDTPHPEVPSVVHLGVYRSGRVTLPYKSRLQIGHNAGLAVGQLPVESAEPLLAEYERVYQAWRAPYPSLGVLSERYGDPTATKLYDHDSIRDKWCDGYDAERARSG